MTPALEFIQYCLDTKEGPACLYYNDQYYPIRLDINTKGLGRLASAEIVAKWLKENKFWCCITGPRIPIDRKYYNYHADENSRHWFRSWSPI